MATDDKLREHFGDRYDLLPPAINTLLADKRLNLFEGKGKSAGAVQVQAFQVVKKETAEKFEGFGSDQMLVYQTIAQAKDKGIWTKDIKSLSNISQQVLNRSLSALESRFLIKSVRSVASKSKKLYMLYEVEPATEITGGPWYSENQDFDYAFVEALSDFITRVVGQNHMLDLASIFEKVNISDISKVTLKEADVQLIINSLVFDERLEEVHSSVLLITGYATGKKVYKIAKPMDPPASLTNVPCGMCPLVGQCVEGGVISPSSCEYMTLWLDVGASAQHALVPPGRFSSSSYRSSYSSRSSSSSSGGDGGDVVELIGRSSSNRSRPMAMNAAVVKSEKSSLPKKPRNDW